MSKITQARARQDRRELKALEEKFTRYAERSWPGQILSFYIPVGAETCTEIKLAERLGFDVVYRFDAKEKRLSAFAVRR